jgi:hypothetical protein
MIDKCLIVNSLAQKRPDLQVTPAYSALGSPSSHGHPGSSTQIDGSLQGSESLTERNDALSLTLNKQSGRNRRTQQQLTGAL